MRKWMGYVEIKMEGGGGWWEGAGTKGRSWEGMRWVEKGWRMGWEVSIFLSTNLVLT